MRVRAPPELLRLQRALQVWRVGKLHLGGTRAALAELFPHLRRRCHVRLGARWFGGRPAGCQRPQVHRTNARGPTAHL